MGPTGQGAGVPIIVYSMLIVSIIRIVLCLDLQAKLPVRRVRLSCNSL